MRRLRVPTLFDHDLWVRARWSAVACITPAERPPVLILVFQDGDAATDIFLGWHATLGAIDVLDVLRVAILEHAAPTGGRTIHFHLSTDTPSAPGEWLHAPAPADTPFERFRTQLEVHDRYLLIPAALDGGFTPMPNLGIGKHRVCFRRTDDITSSDDPDAGLVMP